MQKIHPATPTTEASVPVRLASVRIFADDVQRVAAFYEDLTGRNARWLTDDFAEISTASGTVAVSHPRRTAFIGEGAPSAGENRSAIVEFLVDDVDAAFQRLGAGPGACLDTVVQVPTTMPWGNRSLLLRDPEGTLVNLYAPITAEAHELQRQRN